MHTAFLGLSDVVVFTGFFAFVGLFIAYAITSEKKRQAKLLEAVSELGLHVMHSPAHLDRAAAENAFGRLGLMRALRKGGSGVRFAASGAAQGRELTLVEHGYTSGSGDSKTTIRHAIAATPCPVAWPELRLTSESRLRKLAEWAGAKDIEVEDPAFNARWKVRCTDPEFAVVLLTPEVQRELAAWPRHLWIEIGHGAVTVAARGYLTADRARELAAVITGLTALIPRELEVWTSAPMDAAYADPTGPAASTPAHR